MSSIETPIVIIGGGAAGLSSSLLLSGLGVDHVLVERRPTTSKIPKAHLLNQRTMEIFRQLGIDDQVTTEGAVGEFVQTATWRTSLGGDGVADGKAFAKVSAFGGGDSLQASLDAGPAPAVSCHQMKLEPILRRNAEERNPGKVLFSTEVVELTQDADGVTVVVKDVPTGEISTIRAQYAIGADGGKFVGPTLGISMVGSPHLQDNVSMHFSADLSAYMDDGSLLNWFVNVGSSETFGLAAGVVVPIGRGRSSQEWVLHCSFPPDEADVNEQHTVQRLRSLLKLPDLEVTVHQVNKWKLESIIADRFQVGRVFIVGDAAHRHPPTIGIGMNSAFGDASNIAWKLAAVVKGLASPDLLDAYESERRPVIRRNVDAANTTYYSHMMVNVVLGMMPGMSLEVRQRALEEFFADNEEAELRRERAQRHIDNLFRSEFQALGLEVGYVYRSDVVAVGGEAAPAKDCLNVEGRLTTYPGSRLPHAWLESAEGRVSTLDLTGAFERFVLITQDAGSGWAEAARQVGGELGVDVRPVVVAPGGDLEDVEGRWAAQRGVAAAGAVLVRPDNHVVWRSSEASADPAKDLETALRTALAR